MSPISPTIPVHPTSSSPQPNNKLVIATRLHLGNASAPPSTDKIRGWIQNLQSMAMSVDASHAMIAVDAASKIPGYDYVQAIQEQVDQVVVVVNKKTTSITAAVVRMVVLPVTPWGKFVPALNALVHHAHSELQADQILMVSAEVSVSASSIRILSDHCGRRASAAADGASSSGRDEDNIITHGDAASYYVLVAGAALNGHLYHQSSESEEKEDVNKTVVVTTTLNGRTCPWNTLAIWNVPKLAVTGFLPVSEYGSTAGVEECAAIAVHQRLFPQARAKLVRLPDVQWQVDNFDDDEERKQWHERKMNSKLERAEAQLKVLQLVDEGRVEHC